MPPPAETFASRLFLGPALRSQPDRRLVTLVREGYESAFEEIVRRYGKALTRYAAAIVGSRGEDVTQDAFSKALLALRRNDAEIELRPWLFRIVRNTALNDLRDSPPTPELLAEAIAGGDSPAETLERREELTDLMHRLRSLPETQRAAIVMREMEGLSHEEIATALGVSGGAARQAIHRARRALRDGAGMLVPLPLLKALLAAGSMGTAEVATAGAGGTIGAGVALKAVTATVLVAGAVGAGVAVHDGRHGGDRSQQAATQENSSGAETTSPTAFAAPAATSDDDRSGHERGDDRGRGTSEPGDDRGHGKNEQGDDQGGRHGESGTGDDHGGGGPGPGDDGGGGSGSGDRHGGSSGSGSGRDGGDSHSGSGSSGGPGPSGGGGGGGSSGHGGSGHGGSSDQTGGSGGSDHSGSGPSDDLATDPGGGSGGGPGPSEPSEPTETNGGSDGSGPSDGSGSGSDGTSGSGSGSDDDAATGG
jgi:RNA polymerase sigma factor (sigma-70 family)